MIDLKDINAILNITRYTYLKREFDYCHQVNFNKFSKKKISRVLILNSTMIKFPAYFTAWIFHVVLLIVAALQFLANGRLILVETKDNAHGMHSYYKYLTDT